MQLRQVKYEPGFRLLCGLCADEKNALSIIIDLDFTISQKLFEAKWKSEINPHGSLIVNFVKKQTE